MKNLLRRRRRLLLDLLLVVLLLTGLRMSGLFERQLVYFPDRELIMTPQAYRLSFEGVALATTDGERLHGWFLPGQPEQPALLFLHGNAGNISHRVENLWLLHQLGLNVLIFDYRGFGESSGTPSETGLARDADAALAWLRQRGWSAQRTVYFGRSLGAAVAIDLARRQPPAGLIVESPFTSLRAMGRQHYPLLDFVFGWLLRDRFDNLDKIGSIKAPLLLFQGNRDQIVPEAMARQLFAAAREPKSFHLIPGANHDTTYEAGGAAYWQAWRDFLASLSAPPPSLPEEPPAQL